MQVSFQRNVDSFALDQMTKDWDFYETHKYIESKTPHKDQGAGRNWTDVRIGEMKLTVKSSNGWSRETVLHNVLHYPFLFTNLESASSLQKKKWYLHGGIEAISLISDNFQLVTFLILNGLYVFLILHKTFFAEVAQKNTSLKT